MIHLGMTYISEVFAKRSCTCRTIWIFFFKLRGPEFCGYLANQGEVGTTGVLGERMKSSCEILLFCTLNPKP